ncbi:MAG: phage holin family protein [Pseudomonadota bacterium]
MNEAHRQSGAEHLADPASDVPDVDKGSVGSNDKTSVSPPSSGHSLIEELGALIDDGRTYAEAEIAFQKTRAKLGGKLVGTSLLLVIVALILLHITFLALAVGLVIALEPLVTIWGAIAIVVGSLLALVGLLAWMAVRRTKKLGSLFESPEDGADQ